LYERRYLFTAVLHNKAGMRQGDDLIEPLKAVIQPGQVAEVFLPANTQASLPVNRERQLFFNAFDNKGLYGLL
jgi:hypothetical protein